MIAGKKKGQSKMRFLMSFDTRKIPRRAIVHSAKLYIYLVDFAASNGANEPSVVYSNSLEVYQIISTDWHPENTTSVIPWHQNFLGIGKDVAKNRYVERLLLDFAEMTIVIYFLKIFFQIVFLPSLSIHLVSETIGLRAVPC